MSGIFLNYRRSDAEAWAGRLHESLQERLPGITIFRDIDAVPIGVKFSDHIAKAVDGCDVFLTLIGPSWLDSVDAKGIRRLDDPNDFVRTELAAALRAGKPIVPILVGGAAMPAREALPPDLQGLADWQNYEIPSRLWNESCDRLASSLKQFFPTLQPAPPPAPPVHDRSPWQRWPVIAAVIVALVAGGVALYNRVKPRPEVQGIPAPATPSGSTAPTGNPPKEKSAARCAAPIVPVLSSPGENQVVPNHYYGQGEPWKFEWLPSSCKGGSIKAYRIIVKAVGVPTPAVDKIVTQTRYIGDTSGTIRGRDWTWKVLAIDDLNHQSDWSEERRFVVGVWPGSITASPPDRLLSQAEQLTRDWIDAVTRRNVDRLVSLSALPFSFDRQLVSSAAEIRNRYMRMVSEPPPRELPAIVQIKADSIATLKKTGQWVERRDPDRVLESMGLDDDSIIVKATLKAGNRAETVTVFFRKVGSRVELAGFLD